MKLKLRCWIVSNCFKNVYRVQMGAIDSTGTSSTGAVIMNGYAITPLLDTEA